MHSSFLLALPLAHVGTARYLPWINSRNGLAGRNIPAIQAVPMMANPEHESMSMSMTGSMSMSHSIDDDMKMPKATVAPLFKRQLPNAQPTVLISPAVAEPTQSFASVAIASVALPSASGAVGFAPKSPKDATNFSVVSIAIPTASASLAVAIPLEPKAPAPTIASVKASASSSAAPKATSASFSSSSSAGRALPTANPSPSAIPVPAPVPVAPIPAPAPAPIAPIPAPAPVPVVPNQPSQPIPPRNPQGPIAPIAPAPVAPAPIAPAPISPAGPPVNTAFELAIANGLDLNVLTSEAQFAASTDLLEMAQKGNPLDQTLYNVARANLKALQGAGVNIRVNNMQLAKTNPKVLRSLAQLQAEQAKELELASKLTGDATGDLSVLIQLQKMLATGIQKQSAFIEQTSPQGAVSPKSVGATNFPATAAAAPATRPQPQGQAQPQAAPAAAATRPRPQAQGVPAAGAGVAAASAPRPVPAAAAQGGVPAGAPQGVPRPAAGPEDEE